MEKQEPENEPVVKSVLTLNMPALSLEEAARRHNAVVEFTQKAMKEGRDYGKIPGSDKPTLLKPGAEKLCTLFGLTITDPEILTEVEDWTGKDHNGEPFFYYKIRQRLVRDGEVVASQIASCNSWETKYRYRKQQRACPKCSKETINKSKLSDEWYCWAKIGGCGATFRADDERILSQQVGRVLNTDVADIVNTVQKMAQKRALIAACLIAVNASEFFTQDLEDIVLEGDFKVVPASEPAGPKPQKSAPTPPAKPSTISRDQGKELAELMKHHSVDARKFFQFYSIKRLGELPADHYADALSYINDPRHQTRDGERAEAAPTPQHQGVN